MPFSGSCMQSCFLVISLPAHSFCNTLWSDSAVSFGAVFDHLVALKRLNHVKPKIALEPAFLYYLAKYLSMDLRLFLLLNVSQVVYI